MPFNATDKTVTYTSSDTGKATVTATGLVTALTAGDVAITVKAGQSEKTVALTIRSLEAGALRMTVDKDNPLFLHGLYKYDGTGYSTDARSIAAIRFMAILSPFPYCSRITGGCQLSSAVISGT